MDDPNVLERMRADWNQRAREDANYYVAFGRRRQEDAEFFASAAGVVRLLEAELPRLKARDAALEIGCGPGRLMRPMARHFGEVHGVDVSDEMIRLARDRLRDVPNAHPHTSAGSDLSDFPGESFDFVYSYAVFQHIPSRDVVFHYLREARRVLKPGGVLRCQLNGLPPTARQCTTWEGVRVSADEIAAFARENGLHLLALEGVLTQYMWVTCRKPLQPRIRNITNTATGEAAVPARGMLAALSLWIENLPPASDLNTLAVSVDGRPCRLIYLGEPDRRGVSQLNAALPEGVRTGLVPVTLPGLEPAWVRLIPAPPPVPYVESIADGVNLLSANRTASGSVKVTAEEVANPESFHAAIAGVPAREIEWFCTDPTRARYEFNFRVPPQIPRGNHELRLALGRRLLSTSRLEVA
ncbi:MAG: methyltransferase domain-containing protein [Bryobacteraceae bacterium]